MLKDRLIFVSLALAAIFNIILWAAVYGKFGLSTEKIPLHFSVVYGIDFLGPARQLFVLPLTGAALFAVNGLLAALLYSREKLLSYFLSYASLVIQAMLIVAAGVIIMINA